MDDRTNSTPFNWRESSTIYNAVTPAMPVDSLTAKPLVPCSTCSKMFTTKRGREIHILGVHLGTRFSCPIEGCGSEFAQFCSLARHIAGDKNCPAKHMDVIENYKVTSSSGRIACRDCPYMNAQSNREIANHVVNEHLGVLFSCPVCQDSSSGSMADLRDHAKKRHPDVMQCYID